MNQLRCFYVFQMVNECVYVWVGGWENHVCISCVNSKAEIEVYE